MAASVQYIEDVLERLDKNMLAKAMPYLFTKEPHEFQSDMKNMARNAMKKRICLEAEKQVEQKRKVEEKEVELLARREESQRCEELLAQRLRENEETIGATVDAAKRIKDEEEIYKRLQLERDAFAEQRNILQTAKEEVDKALHGSFARLSEGKWESEKDREDSVNAVLLQLLCTSKTLQAAVPRALDCEPSARGPFAERVINEVSRLLTEKLTSKTASLQADAEKFRRVSAEALGAWAIMMQAHDGLGSAEKDKRAASEAHQAAKVELSACQEKVMEAEKGVNYALSEQAIIDNLVEDIEKALGFMTDLENNAQTSNEETEMLDEALDKENDGTAKRRKLDHEADVITSPSPLTVANH